MRDRIPTMWACVWILFVAPLGACSKPQKGETGQATVHSSAAPAKAEGASSAFQALTRDKTSEQDYIDAIAALETANLAADVESAVGAGDPRLLGIPRPAGGPTLPGVDAARVQVPEELRFARIVGLAQPATNKYEQRFRMLAMKYATEYNALLLRRIK